MKILTDEQEDLTENGDRNLLFGDEAAARFASLVYGRKITADQICYWRATGRITRRKAGHANVYDPPQLRAELRGQIVP
jgi:hypothetical protein